MSDVIWLIFIRTTTISFVWRRNQRSQDGRREKCDEAIAGTQARDDDRLMECEQWMW